MNLLVAGLVIATALLTLEVKAALAGGVRVITNALVVRKKVLAVGVVVDATLTGTRVVLARDITLEVRAVPRPHQANTLRIRQSKWPGS